MPLLRDAISKVTSLANADLSVCYVRSITTGTRDMDFYNVELMGARRLFRNYHEIYRSKIF